MHEVDVSLSGLPFVINHITKVEGLAEQLRKQMVYVGSGSQSAVLVKSNKQGDVTRGTAGGDWLLWRMLVMYRQGFIWGGGGGGGGGGTLILCCPP